MEGVVNVDGWGPGIGERYRGEDPAQIERYLQRLADGFRDVIDSRPFKLLTDAEHFGIGHGSSHFRAKAWDGGRKQALQPVGSPSG